MALAHYRPDPEATLRLAIGHAPAYIAAGRPQAGLDELEDAMHAVRGRSELRPKALLTLGELSMALNRPAKARDLAHELLDEAALRRGEPEWTKLYLLKTNVHMRFGEYEDAVRCAKIASDEALAAKDFYSAAEATLRITTARIVQNRVGECLATSLEAARFAGRAGDKALLGLCMESRAAALRYNGMEVEAKEAALAALQYLAPLDRPGEMALGLARLGRNLEGLGDIQNALQAYEAALGALEKTDDERSVSEASVYLGDLYNRLGRHAEAEPLLARATAIRSRLNETYGEATALRGLGLARLGMSDFRAAEALLSDASKKFQKFNPLGVASSLVPLAEAQMMTGRPNIAKQNVSRALTIMFQHDARTRERNAPGDLLSVERAQRVASRAHYLI